MNRFFSFIVVAFAMMFLYSAVAMGAGIEKTRDFGFIYWYGGEDVSYNRAEKSLVSVDDSDDIDMYIDMDLKDMEKVADMDDKYAVPSIPENARRNMEKKPMIAIVIDDMGVNREMTDLVLKQIEPHITMSFLPYSTDIQQQVDQTKNEGHEVILHLPWEPERKTANPGPHSLRVSSSKDKLKEDLLANLDAFKGYDGVNNHMGSKFSRYRDGIEAVMGELKNRDLFFLDSRTTADSMAEKIAVEYGVTTSHRNVFLDHVETTRFVLHALQEVERIANQSGTAIAIGHPKQVTIEALAKWLPTLKARGYELVTLKEIINERQTVLNAKVEQNDGKVKN